MFLALILSISWFCVLLFLLYFLSALWFSFYFFFFQAEDGIRDHCVTGVQTCALPIFPAVKTLSDVFTAGISCLIARIPAIVSSADVRHSSSPVVSVNVRQSKISASGRSEERRVGKECRSRWSRER